MIGIPNYGLAHKALHLLRKKNCLEFACLCHGVNDPSNDKMAETLYVRRVVISWLIRHHLNKAKFRACY